MSMSSTDRAEQLALRAQRIGGAGIAAAETADIDAAQAPEHRLPSSAPSRYAMQRLDREFQHAAIMTPDIRRAPLETRRQMHLGQHAAHAAAADSAR